MHFSKNLQYAVSGVLALYIVFFTRPAPQMVVSMLSSPIAQLAALAAVVYVGASVSLLVALVAAVALVLSMPAREYMTAEPKDQKPVDAKDEKSVDPAKAAEAVGKMSDMLGGMAGEKKDEKKPAAMDASNPVSKPSDGKEQFTGAPF
jgi:hypothetical protein